MKWLRYRLEAAMTLVAYGLLRALPLHKASALGGWVATRLGPYSKVHHVALHNLQQALPERSDEEYQRILHRMWDNLGRVFCEYPHLTNKKMLDCVAQVSGAEFLKQTVDAKQPVLVIAGHLGNWELPPVIAKEYGVAMHLLYRPANNKVVDKLVASMRKPYAKGLYAKGIHSARALVRAVKNAEPIAMLIDQKSNDGIAVPFFGMEAMTNPAVAHFVLQHQVQVLPVRCIRTDGCHFRIDVEAPLEFQLTGQRNHDTFTIMKAVNEKLEAWIAEDPAQWFWVHKRWPHSKAMKHTEKLAA